MLEFEPEEYAERWSRLRSRLAGKVDALVASSPETLRYLTGYRSLLTRSKWRPIVLILPIADDREPVLQVPAQDVGIVQAFTPVEEIVVTHESLSRGHDDPIELVVQALERHGLAGARLGLEKGFGQRIGMTLAEHEQLVASLPGATFVDVGDELWQTRAIKSRAEVDLLRRACEISCDGVRAGWEALRPGVTEREIHRIMVGEMISAGADDVWLAISSGAKGYGVFNAYPTDCALRPGDLVWVDGGASFRGYMCDFIRTAVIGDASEQQEHWYTAALESNHAALTAVAPGVEAGEVFGRSLEYLENAGMRDAWGLDVLGHGVGLEIHELPSLTMGSREQLQPGHVITIEPSLSPPNHEHGHYIVEEIVAVTADGTEHFTASLPGELWRA